MRDGGRGWRLVRIVAPVDAIQVRIDFYRGSDPIAGTIQAPSLPRRSFWGWMDLISALEVIAAIDADQSGSRGPAVTEP
jgi:hypothetical protein